MFKTQSSKLRSLHAVEWNEGLAPLIINHLHLALQSQPFYRSIWAILRANMGEIARWNGWDCNVIPAEKEREGRGIWIRISYDLLAITRKNEERGKPLQTFPTTKIIEFTGKCKSNKDILCEYHRFACALSYFFQSFSAVVFSFMVNAWLASSWAFSSSGEAKA